MGNSASAAAPPGQAAAAAAAAGPRPLGRAAKFGTPGEMGGSVLGAAFCRTGATSDKPPVVLVASGATLDLYNGLTADRKLRRRRGAGSQLTCVDFKADTTFGFIALAGTAGGEVVLIDAATLKCVRAGGGGGRGNRGREHGARQLRRRVRHDSASAA